MSKNSSHLFPHIGIDEALASSFTFAGRTYKLKDCPTSVLKELVHTHLPTENDKGTAYRKRLDMLALIRLLDTEDVDELTRWYAVEELLALKVLKRKQFADG